MELKGKVALVTGANRGVGKAYAEALLDAGASKVYAAVRDPSTVTDDRLVPIQLDVTDRASVEAAAEIATDVDIVINNAGVGSPGGVLTVPLDAARQVMETNYIGTLSVAQVFAPILKVNGGGALVNMLSVASWVTMPVEAYAASKSAQWSITNGLRVALREQGTLVVGVHCGFVDTDLTTGLEVDKIPASQVADALIEALKNDENEALADDVTRHFKGLLGGDPAALAV